MLLMFVDNKYMILKIVDRRTLRFPEIQPNVDNKAKKW